ncbi:MAG: NTP transferase domain-containing protein [Xanthomonadales bacterium]|nr:NTP transferase domain-containing protein [Xanthomonadales bacterium]
MSSATAEATVKEPLCYPQPLDAIVLAGTHRNPKRLISGRNKAFLDIAGRPLVRHVVDALLEAQNIDQVFVVGPVKQLGPALGGTPSRVHMVKQQGKMLTNTWAAIYASEARHAGRAEEQVHKRPLLIISCDLPLVSGDAVDDFIARCAAQDKEPGEPVSMLVGVVEEQGVTPFYPDRQNDGIMRPYVELAFGRVRLANIYVARPRHLSHQEFLQTGFTFRKAVDWRNVVKLAFNVLRQPGGWGAAWMTLRMQLALMLSRGKGRLYRKLRAGNTKERVEKAVGDVLGGSIRIVTTPFGGLSLDVDDEQDYQVLKDRYDDWIALHEATPSLLRNQDGKHR